MLGALQGLGVEGWGRRGEGDEGVSGGPRSPGLVWREPVSLVEEARVCVEGGGLRKHVGSELHHLAITRSA